jgi:FixJ family two-component response regulator
MSQEAASAGEIFVVDDDPAVRDVLPRCFHVTGSRSPILPTAPALVSAKMRTPVCIILDVHIPGKSGLDILKELNAQDYPAPIFIISGQGDIAMAVDAIKNGALDFIEKPFRGSDIVLRVREAVEAHKRRQADADSSKASSFHFPGREPLTRREQDVLTQIVAGASSKEAGRHLGISPHDRGASGTHHGQARGQERRDLVRIVYNEGRGQ